MSALIKRLVFFNFVLAAASLFIGGIAFAILIGSIEGLLFFLAVPAMFLECNMWAVWVIFSIVIYTLDRGFEIYNRLLLR